MEGEEKTRDKVRKWLTNKYVITMLVFAVVYLFIGDQSVVKRLQKRRQIHNTEQQVRAAREDTKHALHTMEVLQDTDSLERFAREQYGMHTDKEDVYVFRD